MAPTTIRSTLCIALLLAAGQSVQAQDSGGEVINLVCAGQGATMGNSPQTTLEWDKYDHKYRVKQGYEMSMKGFDSAVTLQIGDNDGRIRLPEKLVPPIHSGGDHQHWWQLEDLIVGANEIRASYKLNGLNHPKLRIDRTTGIITIKGTGQDFTGRCDKIDPGTRRF